MKTVDDIQRSISQSAAKYVDLELCGSQKPICIFLGHIAPPSRIFSVFCVMPNGRFIEWKPQARSSRWKGTLDSETFELLKRVHAHIPDTFRGTYQKIPVCEWDWDCWDNKTGLLPPAAHPLIGRIKDIREAHYVAKRAKQAEARTQRKKTAKPRSRKDGK